MPADPDHALPFARRDVTTAVSLHTLLIITLIVLWFFNNRFHVLERAETYLRQTFFGTTPFAIPTDQPPPPKPYP